MMKDLNHSAADHPIQANSKPGRCGAFPNVPRLGFFLAALMGWVLAGGSPVLAQDAQESKRLRDQAEFAAVSTTGNSDMRTLTFRNRLEYDFSDKVMGTWDLAALYGKQDGEKNAERYSTDLRVDYGLAGPVYLFVRGGWLRDEFAGFNNRYYIGPGIGRHFLDGPRHYVKAEAGLNWTREDYVAADTEDFLEGRGFGQYEYVFSERNKFLQSVEYLQDFEDTDNFKIWTQTAVTSALTQLLSIRVGYEVRYQNRPVPDDLKKTDTLFGVSLVVTY